MLQVAASDQGLHRLFIDISMSNTKKKNENTHQIPIKLEMDSYANDDGQVH